MTTPTAPTRWRRDVTVFLTGQTFSLLGSMLVQYAIMWHLTLVTRSGTVMAVYAVVGFLPQAVVSVFGGVWADRLNRRALVIGADASIAATTLALAILMLSGYDDLWILYLAAAIRSAGAGIQTPAVGALLPQIVPTDKLMRVNGINGTIQSAMMLVAPALAAGMYAWASIEAIFFVDVVTALIGIGLLLLVPVPRLQRADQQAGVRGYLADLTDGVRYVARTPFVRWILAMWGLVFVLIVAPSFLTPLMVVRSFGDEVWKLTVNELAFSIGMTLGGVVVAWWGGLRNRVHMVVITTALFAVLNVGLGLSTNMWVFFGFMFLIGLGVPFFSTPTMTVLQEKVEPERLGRVFGFVGIVMAVAMPVGMAVFGPLADRYSVESLLVAAGVALMVVVVAGVALPSGRRAMAEAEAPAPQDEPLEDEPALRP
ncbi:MFS transporter [Cellulomonas dongxiuzhuiae]|uniref:MFS transporter n=1 Tax=Cellulomonas dongxiuzhuiae TaxID=2819979 RepID=A0ABX8GLW6_9CELL|nr:MFS transporter [Cellulomonas dongxiuzhuiae]MBO3095638.1 MFS transporter [Cellulomonas dongxiuzhuiae]QWC16601.1 MFS transporter [Cellulomonas dongxiuzhuiae]